MDATETHPGDRNASAVGALVVGLWLLLTGLAPPTWAQSSDAETLFSIATQAYRDGLYDLARDQLQTYLTTYPRGPDVAEVSYLLGDYFSRQRDFQRSVYHLQEALRHRLPAALQPDAQYLLGRGYVELGRYPEAIRVFQPLVDTGEGGRWYEAALYWLGEALLNNADVARAAHYLERLTEGFPQSPYLEHVLYALGYAYQRLNAHERGLQALQQLLAHFPQSQFRRPAEDGIARALTALQRFAEAAPRWEQLSHTASSPPEAEEAAFWWAESWARAERCDRAILAFQEYLRRFPGGDRRQQALNAVALCAHAAGDLRAEVAALEALLQEATEPLRGSIILRLAAAYEQLGEPLAALARYSQWLQAFPDHPQRSEVLIRRGLISRQQGDDAQAIADFAEVLRRTDEAPELQLAHHVLAESFIRRNDCAAAAPHLTAVIEQGSREARQQARLHRGACAYRAQAFAEAATDFTALADDVDYRGDRQTFLLPLAYSLAALQRHTEAIARFRQALGANPEPGTAAQALAGLAASLLAAGRVEEALPVYEQVFSVAPEVPEPERLHLRLGLLYRERQELEAAKAHLEAAVGGGDAAIGAEALYQLADLLFAEGATADAMQTLQRLTRQFAAQDHWVSIASYRLALLHEAAERWPEAWQAYRTTATTATDPKLMAAAKERAQYLEETVDVHARPEPTIPAPEGHP
jgi:TolA-binding protein